MTKELKTQADCWKALLNGETLRHKVYEGKVLYKMINKETRVKLGDKPSWDGSDNSYGTDFLDAEDFEIYQEPQWYDNLDGTKENGVWCWVSDESKDFAMEYGIIRYILYKNNKKNRRFVAMNGDVWLMATPLPDDISQRLKEEMGKV